MGTCKKIEEYLSGFVDGEITSEHYAELCRHLGECPECAREAAVLAAVTDVLRPPDEIDMPGPEAWDSMWKRIENEIAVEGKEAAAPAGSEAPTDERAEYERRVIVLGRLRTAKRIFLAAAAVMVAVSVGLMLYTRTGGVTADDIGAMASPASCTVTSVESPEGGSIVMVFGDEGAGKPVAIEFASAGDVDDFFESSGPGPL